MRLPNALKKNQFSKLQLLAFVLVFACLGGYLLMRSFAAGTTANLWVDTNGGSCTRQTTAGAYNDAQACASIQAAVAASQPGDQVIIKAGSYGSQTITSSSTSPGVTITGEQTSGSNAVILSGLKPLGNWVTITNVNVTSGLDIEDTPVGTPNNITFNNIDWTGNWWLSNCCSNITQNGGRIHNYSAAGDPTSIMFQTSSASTPMSNMTLNGVEIDHMTHTVTGSHFEAVRTQGWVSNLTIKNSYFHDNGVNSSQIFISSFTGGTAHTPGPIVIEGNYFDVPVAGGGDGPAFYDINGNMQGEPCPDLTVRYNTDKGSMISAIGDSNGINCAAGSFSNVKISSNIGPRSPGSCNYYTYDHNLWINSTSSNCGATDQTVASTAAAGLTGDGFHINSTSPAKDAGNPSYCPATDRDGDTRPQGNACDIGADEYVAPTNVANLWVDTNGGTCTRNATPAVYNDAAACASLAAAYSAASPGDLVLVKAGSYAASFSGSKAGTNQLTIQSEVPYAVTLGSINFANGTNDIILKNFNITGAVFQGAGVRSSYITFQGNHIFYGIANTGGQVFNLHEVQNWTFDGNTFGPWCCSSVANNSPEAIRLGAAPASIPAVGDCSSESCDITIKNNLFQYISRTQTLWPTSGWGPVPDTTCSNAGDTCHMDGIHVFGAQRVHILNNRFYGVECQAIFFEQGGQPTMNANVDIIGNAISTVSGGCGNAGIILEFATGGADFGGTWNIAFNSGSSYIHSGDSGLSSFIAGSKLNFAGNYMNNQTCDSSTANVAVTYSYNLWLNSNCGGATNAVGSTPAFIDSSGSPDPNINVHLAGSSGTAIDYVPASFCTSNPSLCLSTDIDGQARPQGAAYDAGADEFGSGGSGGGSGPSIGDLNSDGHVNITDLSILLSHYGQSGTAGQGDINNDGTVNITDLSILLSHYGL